MMALMIVPQTTVWAEGEEFTPVQMKQIQKMFEDWSAKQQQPKRPMDAGAPPMAPPKEIPMPSLGDTTKAQPRYGVDFSGGSTLQGGRTIYAKPFVRAPKTIVGGYIDFTITDCVMDGASKGSRDCDDGLDFDQERFVPFFYSQVTDRLSVAAEVEFEHGGPQGNQKDGDIKIEFATMDYRFSDWANLRGGIILVPMGRFNLIHDSPLNDLPLRPMVSRLILPSTFAESGLGLYGTFYPTQLSKVDYEFYVTQGFTGDSKITENGGLRSARGSFKNDNNDNKAIVSRISVSPILGVEVAGSIHHGKWDKNSQHDLTLLAIDGNLQRGPFEIQGEAAWANIEGPSTFSVENIKASTDDERNVTFTQETKSIDMPSNMSGYYVQLNYHFMPDALMRAAPTFFSEASTFTGVVRWGQVDTNTDSSTNRNAIDRLSLGLNFRPTEDSVAKLAYTFNHHEKESDSGDSTNRDGWQFSLATYF